MCKCAASRGVSRWDITFLVRSGTRNSRSIPPTHKGHRFLSVYFQFFCSFGAGRNSCLLHFVLGARLSVIGPTSSPPQCTRFHVHILPGGLFIFLSAAPPPHWLLLVTYLHLVLYLVPGRLCMAVAMRLSPPVLYYVSRFVFLGFWRTYLLYCRRSFLPSGFSPRSGARESHQLHVVSLCLYFRVQPFLCLLPQLLGDVSGPLCRHFSPRHRGCLLYSARARRLCGHAMIDGLFHYSRSRLPAAPHMISAFCGRPPPCCISVISTTRIPLATG